MSGETLAALLWLLLAVLGVLVSVRAVFRGAGRLRRSDEPVARAVHTAELAMGSLFFFAFSVDVSTVLTSLYFLPPLEGATEAENAYSQFRLTVVRWQLVASKTLELLVVFVPELLDRYLTRLARAPETLTESANRMVGENNQMMKEDRVQGDVDRELAQDDREAAEIDQTGGAWHRRKDLEERERQARERGEE